MTIVYILKCENNKYYVGKTERPLNCRIEEHFNRNGSQWTKKYKPLCVIDIKNNADDMDEDKYTKIYMRKYGINNVRGGSYNTLKLPDYKIKALKDEICTANNLCYNCMEKGHYISNCRLKNPNKKVRHQEEKDTFDGWVIMEDNISNKYNNKHDNENNTFGVWDIIYSATNIIANVLYEDNLVTTYKNFYSDS